MIFLNFFDVLATHWHFSDTCKCILFCITKKVTALITKKVTVLRFLLPDGLDFGSTFSGFFHCHFLFHHMDVLNQFKL